MFIDVFNKRNLCFIQGRPEMVSEEGLRLKHVKWKTWYPDLKPWAWVMQWIEAPTGKSHMVQSSSLTVTNVLYFWVKYFAIMTPLLFESLVVQCRTDNCIVQLQAPLKRLGSSRVCTDCPRTGQTPVPRYSHKNSASCIISEEEKKNPDQIMIDNLQQQCLTMSCFTQRVWCCYESRSWYFHSVEGARSKNEPG